MNNSLGEQVGKFAAAVRVYDCGLVRKRIGSRNDGGYVVATDLCGLAEALYVFGVGNNLDFEADFVEMWPDVRVHLFDPAIQSIPDTSWQFEFSRSGIGCNYKFPDNVPFNSILKIDAEWHEWDGFLLMPRYELARFSQLVVEFHVLHLAPQPGLSPYFTGLYGELAGRINEQLFYSYQTVLNKINELFHCHHAHANNSLGRVEVDGFVFPPLIEMSFVRKDLVGSAQPFLGILPVDGLDMPNKADRSDLLDWYPITKGESCSARGQGKSAATR